MSLRITTEALPKAPTLYRVTGEVEAPDGTTYTPEYWGDWHTAATVYQAIIDGATDRDESARVRIDTGPGSKRIALTYHHRGRGLSTTSCHQLEELEGRCACREETQ